MTAFFRFAGLVVLCVATLMGPAHARTPTIDMGESGTVDPAIPTPADALGHAIGSVITPPEDASRYIKALAAAAPDRMTVTPYAESWQGRELVYAVIASPENLARLDEIKANMTRLADPEGLSAVEEQRLIDQTPAVVWLGYGVHGNEISPTDAALATAYRLIASRNNEVVDTILENAVVIIDPDQNPDGRARFVHNFVSAKGLKADPDRYTAEHDQPWPRGRSNHYLFDMNRDWFALTQPETRGRVAAILDWRPIVVVDLHEMGGDSTYFFPPAAEPFNPNITENQREGQNIIGRNNARWFDENGIQYFTREIFDAFYPGYGDMWPTLHGAIAMTYEQASARGLVWLRRDGTEMTYEETVRNHFIASLSTAEAAAENRETLLKNYVSDRRLAIAEGRTSPERLHIFDLSVNRWGAENLGRLLAAQGIEVGRIAPGASACGKRFEDGAIIVDSAQPAGPLVRSLLDENTPLPEDFVTEQERLRDKDLPGEIYDVTAWSLPLMHGVETERCRALGGAQVTPLQADDPIEPIIPEKEPVFGYAVPWTDAGQGRLAAAASGLLGGRATTAPFTMGERTFPRGTVVFPAAGASDPQITRLTELAAELGAELVPLTEGWTESGPNLGSGRFVTLREPKIAMAWDAATSSLSAGAMRYIVERKFGLPVSIIRTRTLPRADLSRYNVLILPAQGGGYGDDLGKGGALSRFVADGGVLIGLGTALRYLSDPEVNLLSIRRENAVTDKPSPDSDGEEAARVAGTIISDDTAYDQTVAPDTEAPDYAPGALLAAVPDPDHWLSSGYDGRILSVLATGSDIYTPLKRDEGTNVFRFVDSENLVQSGYLWAENQAQQAYKPFVVTERRGKGLVIGFTQSPEIRAYQDGHDLLLLNALLFGPAHSFAIPR